MQHFGRKELDLMLSMRLMVHYLGQQGKNSKSTSVRASTIELHNIIASHFAMTTVIARPSSLLSSIRVEKLENFNLFKFNDKLQVRMEELLERKKADLLTPEEIIELEEIGELDRIFTHINAMIVAQK
jgi:hypothetical protein